jgi:DNA modification methylase
LAVDTLAPNPRNPRVHSDRQIKALRRSIETFGFNVPVLVGPAGELVAGHARWLAAKAMGFREVPTISVDHLSETQIQAFIIADNRLAELATWNEELLASQLKELSEVDLDFDLESTGFTMGEIDLRIEGLRSEVTEADDPADALPALGPAICQPGDLWLLGRHRVFCGSALDDRAYALLVGEERAAMVFTDPPYNVPIDGHVSGLGAAHHREFAMASGEMSEAEFTNFLTQTCRLHGAHSVDGALHFICMDWRHIAELLVAGRAVYSELKNLCVWAKDNAGMGSLYRSQHELICVFKHGKASHRNNIELGRHGRNRSNLWQYRGTNSFAGRTTEEGNLLQLHPTVKPVAMIADAIMDCSARGEVVLDGFLGSGSTLIAAERTGRRCFGLEIDPLYVDTLIRRWQAFSGEKAVHGSSGKSFDALSAAAEAADAG